MYSQYIKLMEVTGVDERGVALVDMAGNLYFMDRKEAKPELFKDVGTVLPVVVVNEKDKYGFVVSVDSIVDIGKKILELDTVSIDSLFNIVYEKSGYFNNINNILEYSSSDLPIYKKSIYTDNFENVLDKLRNNTNKLDINNAHSGYNWLVKAIYVMVNCTVYLEFVNKLKK